MASGVLSLPASALSSFPAPLAIATQLTLSSATIAFAPANSLVRPAALPLISLCVYSVLHRARAQMRGRWASLLGGASFTFFLQYLDVGLVRKWNWSDRGPASPNNAASKEKVEKGGAWPKFRWAWSTMFALRHVNTKYEARNTPPFKDSDPTWVPSKRAFLMRESITALVCYLLLDLMAQRPPPANASEMFDKALIPLFSRLSEVTIPQLRLRALSIAGFGATFWALIRGYAATAGTITVALGMNEPRDWRPPFGSLSQAYSIQNLWGKVWHQNLRSLLVSPARKITYEVFGLKRGTLTARSCFLLISFTLSGLMHSCAGIASGRSPKQFNVLHFFLTQALGVVVEETVQLVLMELIGKRTSVEKEQVESLPGWQRLLGYLWLAAFMSWSGPVWLYPQASSAASPGQSNSFVPYSFVRAWRNGDVRAGLI